MSVADHPYASFLRSVQKPAQYLGGESGERKKPWNSVEARVCLAFPDLYEIGMSHLGTKILYKVLNDHPKILAERSYAVWADKEAALRANGERLRSLESARPLADFDVVGISLQFELTYTNVLQLLDLGGIAIRSADRDDDAPLVLAGGPSATHPEVLADFVDAFVIGDGEEKAPEVALTWARLRASGMPRRERLRILASLGAVYVPSLYPRHIDESTGLEVVDRPVDDVAPYPITRAVVADIDAFPFPSDSPVPSSKAIFDRMGIEISRGCTEGCRFCQAGMIYRPVRERNPESIVSTIVAAVRGGGYDEASLTSLSTADYSAIAPLVHRAVTALAGTEVQLSVSSLRAYGLSEDVLDDMATQRASGLTFAPEAGTQRMRDVINKNVTEEQLLETAERVFSRGWSKMKLYFMIGLPTEGDEDVIGIVETGVRALRVGQKHHGRARPRVTVSVSTLVPKPHTPFQWCATNSIEEIERKHRILRDTVRRTRVFLRTHRVDGTWIEGALARGDRKLGAVLHRAYELGARFDSWSKELDASRWKRAFEDVGVDPWSYLGTLPVDARLPWDHIDVGLAPGFLAREYRRAVAGRLSPPCGKMIGQHVFATNVEDAQTEKKRLVCYHCGVACDLDAMRTDRVEKLVTLGAKSKRVRTVEETPKPDRDRRVMRGVDQGPKRRLRIAYAKRGTLAWSAHLDVVRLFPRIFRRADLPVVLSSGFTPAPELSYGPALSLGVASLGEYLDVELRADLLGGATAEDLLARLRDATFDGLDILECVFLGATDASITRVLREAQYVIGIPRAVLADLGLADEDAVAARVAERMAMPKLEVRRDYKGIGKIIDVRSYLLDARVGDGLPVLREAGFAGDLIPTRTRASISQEGAAKSFEIAAALLDAREEHVRIVRAGTYAQTPDGEAVSPLSLDRFRKPRSSPATRLSEDPHEQAP